MSRIDLHAHTTCSDGTLSPTALVEEAAAQGLAAVAITDHDTTEGLPEAFAAGERLGIEVIGGCEVSANYEGTSVHVLAHGITVGQEPLASVLVRVRSDREKRNTLMLERLTELGCPLEMEEVVRHASGRIVARPHFAWAMVDRGHVKNTRQAFDRYLKDGGPAHVVVARLTPLEAVTAIVASGGAASIAHPGQIGLPNREAWDAFLAPLAEAGLAALEVHHPRHDANDRDYFHALATDHGLLASGGSDFHGAMKPKIRLGRGDGTIDISYITWDALQSRRRPADPS